ncbi:helix-turn-helix domain-containing protein [Pseudomonas sp. NPDC089734]|uniref:helix-turn-helix domain-containing protein n=1 Tax=Pseudomonas sp. NPDC089734 TaxID=3364469 RepID=UPI0037F19E55
MTGIGPRLKRERVRLKLSQSALGAIGGVETNAQGNYENGIRSPRADYLSRISDVGIDVAYVVTGFSPDRTPLTTTTSISHDNPDHLGRTISRLHSSLHEVSQNVYQMAKLLENNDSPPVRTQLEVIKNEAEAITIASVRLIYLTSKLT